MKILFLVRHFSYLRNFESAIVELATRGHTLRLSADREESLGGREMIERLCENYPNVTHGTTPGRDPGPWVELVTELRLGVDYVRFLAPEYLNAPKLRLRAKSRAPALVVLLMKLLFLRTRKGRWLISGALRALEHGIPCNTRVFDYIKAQAPDAVLITPLVGLGQPQVDHLWAAKALGLRTALPVGSWDHLSSKSLLRQIPDLITVWNGTQKNEAVEMHGVPEERVVVTGGQGFDQWFDRRPSRTREAFCDRVGLPADRPFITYVCSSLFRKTANEARFVEEWLQRIRTCTDPALKTAGILVRPHPARLDEWKGSDISEFRDVAFFGAHPVEDQAKNDYFDSLYYSAAVVGLNTSAFLEAAAVGRPCYTILLPEISKANQEGTIHFHYLLTVNGGLLHPTRDFDAHLADLSSALRGPAESERSRRFAEAFIRPYGLDTDATPRFADAIEALEQVTPPAPETGPWWGWLMRLLLYPWLWFIDAKVRTVRFRKETRYKTRRVWRNFRKRFWLALRRLVAVRLKAWDKELDRPHPGPSALTPKLGRQRPLEKVLTGQDLPEAEETRERITDLGRTNQPIILGPWVSETGFELLYWIPFLTWAKTYGNLPDERLVVVSRGGAAPWYRHITTNYQDILSFYSPDEFRELNDRRIASQHGKLKHLEVSEVDKEIIDQVLYAIGVKKAKLIHPSMMYTLFQHFWRQESPMTIVESFTAYRTLPPVGPSDLGSHLPDDYVAAKFYGNSALPDTEDNRRFIASLLRDLTQTTDVVLLNTPDRYDDHSDFPADTRARLHTIDHLMTPTNNLEVQTRVISGARGFVGTYGGFSYLAPLSRVNAVAFYSHPTGFRFDHLDVAKRVFSSLDCGSFVPLDVRDVSAVRCGLGFDVPERRLNEKESA